VAGLGWYPCGRLQPEIEHANRRELVKLLYGQERTVAVKWRPTAGREKE